MVKNFLTGHSLQDTAEITDTASCRSPDTVPGIIACSRLIVYRTDGLGLSDYPFNVFLPVLHDFSLFRKGKSFRAE